MKRTKLDGKACMITLRGESTASDENALLGAYRQAISDGCRAVILDFTEMSHMDSGGASLLVKLSVEARRERQPLAAFGLGSNFRQVFRLTGLDRAIHVRDSLAQAIAACGVPLPTQQPAAEGVGSPSGASPQPQPEEQTHTRDTWAQLVGRLKVPQMPAHALDLNVDGCRPVGPVEGFGPMWQKTYRILLDGIAPTEAIRVLKDNFPSFQPPENRFYPSSSGIQPGEVVLINASTTGFPVATGVLVLYADEESFTLMTPQGHPESGWVTFSASTQDRRTLVQIQGLARASDPLYEVAFRLAGSKAQERIWRHVLASMASHLGVEASVDVQKVCVDAGLQWGAIGNLWFNAQIRTMGYLAITWPFRSLRRLFPSRQ